MSIDLSEDSLIFLAKNQASSDLDDETVILHVESGKYYGLKGTGASIWKIIQEGSKSLNELREIILANYEVDSEQCDRDLLALLQELLEAGLIEVNNEATA